jgi:hypothetical protein
VLLGTFVSQIGKNKRYAEYFNGLLEETKMTEREERRNE